MTSTAPPSAAKNPSDSFVKSAAKASVAAPIVALVLGYFDKDLAVEDHLTILILVAIHWLLIGTGLILACTALVLMRRRGTKGVWLPAAVGLIINTLAIIGVIYFFFGPGAHEMRKWDPAEARWQQFNSVTGRFTVLLPGPGVEKQTEMQGIVQHQVIAELPDRSGYAVTWLDPPVLSEKMDYAAVQQLLDAAVQSQVDKGGELLDRHTVETQGHVGREFRLKRPGKHGPVVLVQRNFVVGTRVYQLLAEINATEQETRATEINRFLDSFKPTENPGKKSEK